MDPEVRGQVDDAAARAAQPGHGARRRRVRQRRERELDAAREGDGIDRLEAQIEPPAQRGKHVAHIAPRALLRGHCRDLEFGMPQQDPQQLEARIPAGPDDCDLHTINASRTGTARARRAGRTSSAPSCARRGSRSRAS